MHKKNLLNSPRILEIKKKREKALKRKIIFSLVGLVIFFIGLTFLSRLKSLNITEVNILGNEIIDTADIENVVNENTTGKYLWLMPKTNFLLLPKDKIRLELEDKYKRLKDVEVKITGNRILEVFVDERTPLYTWCGENLDMTLSFEDVKCYFMDESGFIFDEAPYFSGDVYFRFFGKVAEPTNPRGEYFLGNDFPKVESFYKLLSHMDIELIWLYVIDNTEGEIYLARENSVNSPKILFNLDYDLLKLAENLQSALTTEPLKTEIKDKYDSLEYIDLRFENRVYYKFHE